MPPGPAAAPQLTGLQGAADLPERDPAVEPALRASGRGPHGGGVLAASEHGPLTPMGTPHGTRRPPGPPRLRSIPVAPFPGAGGGAAVEILGMDE